MKRPTTNGEEHGTQTTTPRVADMMQLLGAGCVTGSIALGRDEFRALQKLYGFKTEQPRQKPPPPTAPDPLPSNASHEARRKHEEATRIYKIRLADHAKWTDPAPYLEAGAQRNVIRYAESDGLRLMAWIAKYVSHDGDPLKTLIQFARDAGVDVDPEDSEWADTEDEEDA